MATIDCTFHLTDFQLDSVIGEEDKHFLILCGEGMALELWWLDTDTLQCLIKEIEDALARSEEERKQHAAEELLYEPPKAVPCILRFCFYDLGNLQALYQPPDHLWQMVFEDGEDESQCDIWMSTQQVESLLKRLKEEAAVK